MKKRKAKSLSWWHVPFLSPIASLGVLRGDFLPSSTRFSQSLAVGLPHFSGHGNSFPCSAVSSPCKAVQGSAWPPTPAQPRLLNQVSNQQGTPSYHNAHESQLFSLSTSWAAIAQLSLFLKKPGPWMGWVESGGSWEEWRWVSRERKALWGGSTNSSKSLPPMLCCLAVAFVKPTGSYPFLKPTGSWLPQWPWEVWTPCHCLWQTNSNSSRSTH